MSQYNSPQQVWTELDGRRSAFMSRCERYAQLLMPRLLYPTGVSQENHEISRGYGSLASQCVTNLAGKIVMAMFNPVAPYMQLDLTAESRRRLAETGVEEESVPPLLFELAKQASGYVGKSGQRPKLHVLWQHLIVLGNCLLIEESRERLRVLGLRNYVCERDSAGDVIRAVIAEPMAARALSPAVRELLGHSYNPDTKVTQYRYLERQDHGGYLERRAIDAHELPGEFQGVWTADRLPYHFLTWSLQDGDSYGTGLGEEFSGDFEALELLDQGIVDGGVRAAEFRWGIDPAMGIDPKVFEGTVNGEAIPATKNGMFSVSADLSVAHTLQLLEKVAERRERRVGQAFLLGSAMVRNGERVTAEEIRLIRSDLETPHSGVMSYAATHVQRPIAVWSLKALDVDLEDAGLELSIPSGLEGLARANEADNLRVVLSDLAAINQIPEEYRGILKRQAVSNFFGAGRGVRMERFLMTEQEAAEATQRNAALAGQAQGIADQQQGQANAPA